MTATFGGNQTSLGGRQEGDYWVYDDGSRYNNGGGKFAPTDSQIAAAMGPASGGAGSNARPAVTSTPPSVSYTTPSAAPTPAPATGAVWGGSTPASSPSPSPAPAPGTGGAAWGGTATNAPAAPAASPSPAVAPAPSSAGIIASQLSSPSAWNVTADQTVEGRLKSLTDPNSPIIAQARARKMEEMAARGLQNSSMALGAADAAAYDVAVPIATADAATAAKAAGYNVDQANQFAVRNTDYSNQFKLQEMADRQAREIALINRDTQAMLTNLDASLRAQADQVAAQNKRLLDTNAQAASAYNTAMSAINNIQNNAQMDADAKTRAIANVWRDTQIQLNALGAVAGLNLTQALTFANYPGFDANGNWVGFEDGPGAVTRGSAPAAPPAGAPAPAPGTPGGPPVDTTGAGA